MLAEIESFVSSHHLINAWSVTWALYLASIVIWILLQKRSPLSTLLWVMTLALLPYLGYAVYYFFGPQRLKRQHSKRLRSRLNLSGLADTTRARQAQLEFSPATLRLSTLIRNTAGAPLSAADDVRLLSGGGETYDAFLEAIADARDHIHVEFYIYEPDQTGKSIRDALIDRAKKGITVRFLVDALGSARLGRKFLQPMREAGIEVGFFHRVRIGRRIRPVTNYRNHRKILICDGRIGFTGGLNITDDENERINPDTAYHDAHIRIEGAAVRWLQLIFLEDWTYSTGQRIRQEEMDALLPELPPGPYSVQILSSGPDDPRESIHRTQVAAIEAAQERVWLTTAYFVPSEPALTSLTNAALKGLDVRLLVPARGDSRVVTAAARSYFAELMEAGVKVWEFQDRMLHSKTLLIDNDYSFIGTANFDNRSFRLNYEVQALLYGPTVAKQFGRQFEQDQKRSIRVNPKKKDPWWRLLGDAAARVLSPIL